MERDSIVMYDFDGTLAKTIVKTAVFFNDMFERFKHTDSPVYPIPLEYETVKKLFTKATMAEFLLSNSFTKEEAREAHAIYHNVFGKEEKYQCNLFPGITSLLRNVGKQARQIIVSSNNKENITPVLQRGMVSPNTFESIVGGDELNRLYDSGKAGYIRFHMGHSQRMPDEITYVGDTMSDYTAAEDAGVSFVGVNYGWGEFPKGYFPVAESVEELEEILLNRD